MINAFYIWVCWVLNQVHPYQPSVFIEDSSPTRLLLNKVLALKGVELAGLSYKDYDLTGIIHVESLDELLKYCQLAVRTVRHLDTDLDEHPYVKHLSKVSLLELIKRSIRLPEDFDELVKVVLDEFEELLIEFDYLPEDEKYRYNRHWVGLINDVVEVVGFIEKKHTDTHFITATTDP